jgi:hypothetical protein
VLLVALARTLVQTLSKSNDSDKDQNDSILGDKILPSPSNDSCNTLESVHPNVSIFIPKED